MARRLVRAEVEAKLLVPRESDLRAIARLERLGSYRMRSRGAARLHSIYLDTADLALARHGVALRLRRHASRWEATAKWAGHVDGDVHERPELTLRLRSKPRMPFILPRGDLALHLGKLVAARPLRPILITEIHRRHFDITPAKEAEDVPPIAELALDRVRLKAPGRRETALTYYEAEIELQHGTRRDITNIARLLRERFHLMPSTESKLARGLALLYG